MIHTCVRFTSNPHPTDPSSVMPVKEKVTFPDFLRKWPFPRTSSPYLDVAAESDEWFQSFKALSTQEEMDGFKHTNFGTSIFPSQPRISPNYLI